MSTNCYVLDPLAVNPIDRSVTKLLYVSVARYSTEWHSILHTHPCAEVFFVTGGYGHLKLADGTLPINVGDFIIVNSNVEHTEVSSEEHPLEYIVMGVDGLEALSGDDGGKGYSIVEVLSTCPTNWGLSPAESLQWLRENMLPYYPLGVYKDVPEGVKKGGGAQ